MTRPDCETRAMKGPGTEWRSLPVSQPLILRQYNPTPFANLPKSDAVLLIPCEVIVVHLHGETIVHKLRSDRFRAEGPVYEEYRPIRRLRSGWLLRSH